jgi:hypothetical protein
MSAILSFEIVVKLEPRKLDINAAGAVSFLEARTFLGIGTYLKHTMRVHRRTPTRMNL